MKKIVIASVLGASLFGANAGISEAASCPLNNNQAQPQQQPQLQQGQIDPAQLIKNLPPELQQQIQKGLAQMPQLQQQAPAPKQQQAAPAPAPKQQQAAPAPAPKQPTQAAPAPKTEQPQSQASADLTAQEKQMLDKVNQERQKAGVPALTADPELTKMARVKAKDMIDNNYFDHNSPKYGSPFDMMKTFGIEYNTAGENLAGNQTVDAAHTALMNSQGHRENILKSDYTKVGIGIVDGGPYGKMFVQEFKG
ncbi:CAP domain-containing protein [Fictibacillus barbaricus]|uniref:YkwD family protein n=1 Tax=Fictibacillus barbaricus TaxID=182136 RepID=A0ABU1TVJ0_9BACL|nr:CAP domain-containing protein [Fictibacillus barbaricus]MDR7071229.1 putative YkwD family protein [Fictibacillus barbaricus]